MKASIKINTKSIQFQECPQGQIPDFFSIQEILIRPSIFGVQINPGISYTDRYGQQQPLLYLTIASIIFEHKHEEEIFKKLLLIESII